MRLIVIGIPGTRRSELLRAAADAAGVGVVEIAWREVLASSRALSRVIRGGDLVRIDSPGRDFETERALLRLGLESLDNPTWPAPGELEHLTYERGRLHWPGTWYQGLCLALDWIAKQLSACPPHRLLGSISAIKTMFDKTATHAHLAAAGVAVAPAIGRVSGYDELVMRVRDRGWSQVFAKLAHGSSAAGAIAIRFGRDRAVAMTTVEVREPTSGDLPGLYNTRKLRTLVDERDIGYVVDALAPHGLHVERWLPKAGIDGRTFDLRVLTIGGEPAHVVVRTSESPMTNLHLLNRRGDLDRVRDRCGDAVWDAVMQTCRNAAAAFPDHHCIGLDVLIDNTFRNHVILEANAFGDLLPGVLHDGMDAYAAQLRSLQSQYSPAEVA